MPELPEVETIARDLKTAVVSQRIRTVKVHDAFILRDITQVRFVKQLEGMVIRGVYRRGKALVVGLSSGFCWVIQPMMTGQVVYFYPSETPLFLKETRVEVAFSDGGVLLYHDQRRFGQMRLVARIEEIAYIKALGPEPLSEDFHQDYVRSRLRESRRPIKNVLLDHTFVAGIGNIYASEILFRANIKPQRPASQVRAKEIPLLVRWTKDVLSLAIEHRGSSVRNYRDGRGEKGTFNQLLQVYGREDRPCWNCRSQVKRIVQAGRSSFYCSLCQR